MNWQNSTLGSQLQHYLAVADNLRSHSLRTLWIICCLLASGLAGADDLSLSMLARVPQSIEINGVVITASGSPYFNLFPGAEHTIPTDCQQHGNFTVIITLHVPDANVRKQLAADRVWVLQGQSRWSGRVLKSDITKSDFRRPAQDIGILARDCNAPFAINDERNEIGSQKAPRAKVILELIYAGKRYLLRLPDAGVESAS